MNKNDIIRLKTSFDSIAQTVPDSTVEFWYARDLMPQLGYTKWQNFTEVIGKASVACEKAGAAVDNHFTGVSRMVQIGSGAERPIDDIILTRYACYLIPAELTKDQINLVYTSEADVLNMALFGKTAKQWRDQNPDEKGNIRDFANVSQLVCLANLETLNAHFIQDGLGQSERLAKLNQTAIQQMRLLLEDRSIKQLKEN